MGGRMLFMVQAAAEREKEYDATQGSFGVVGT